VHLAGASSEVEGLKGVKELGEITKKKLKEDQKEGTERKI